MCESGVHDEARSARALAASKRNDARMKLQALRDREPNGILGGERLGPEPEAHRGVVAEGGAAAVLEDSEHVDGRDDAVHEPAHHRVARVLLEIVAVVSDSAVEATIGGIVPTARVRAE